MIPIFRVHFLKDVYTSDSETGMPTSTSVSEGFGFYTSSKAANEAARVWKKKDPARNTVEHSIIPLKDRRIGTIIDLLRTFASHPD